MSRRDWPFGPREGISPAHLVETLTTAELEDFVGGWEGKLQIPERWVSRNLSAAHSELKERKAAIGDHLLRAHLGAEREPGMRAWRITGRWTQYPISYVVAATQDEARHADPGDENYRRGDEFMEPDFESEGEPIEQEVVRHPDTGQLSIVIEGEGDGFDRYLPISRMPGYPGEHNQRSLTDAEVSASMARMKASLEEPARPVFVPGPDHPPGPPQAAFLIPDPLGVEGPEREAYFAKHRPRRSSAARSAARKRAGPGDTRQFNGRTFIRLGTTLHNPTKAQARAAAARIRGAVIQPMNARVVPTANGWRVYVAASVNRRVMN